MPRHDEKKESWVGRKEARNYIIWLILWIAIDLVIVTWIFSSAPGQARQPEVFAPHQVVTMGPGNPHTGSAQTEIGWPVGVLPK